MAYLSEQQNLDGLFTWLGKTAAVQAGKQIAKVAPPQPKAPGVIPLTPTRPTMPPLVDEVRALPPAVKPLPPAAPAPKSKTAPIVNQMQSVAEMIGSALRSIRSSERPLATAIGTNLPTEQPMTPTATRVPQAPSGKAPSSPPIDVETRAIVNGAGVPVVPMVSPAPMPPWVIPAALAGGGLLLFMMMRRR